MNKSIRAKEACKYLICALLITGASACDKTGFAYDNIVDNGATEYIVIDSSTMYMSTVYIDSIPTSDQNIALCGIHNDPVFGTVSASSYWQVKAFSGTTIPNLAVYDSMVLVMRPNKTTYGDTSKLQDLGVYRVTENIKKPLTNTYLYSNYSFATESTPLGSKQFTIRPTYDTVIRIKLDDALGNDFFLKSKTGVQTIKDQTQFSQYFKGLALKPGANSQLIHSFRADDSLVMRLYYHASANDQTTTSIDFALYNAQMQFNHIDYVRVPGSPLESLTKANDKLLSTAADNKAYIQPLTQVMTRIDIPYLKNLSQLHKFFKVMRATLTVRPEQATYQYPYLLPQKLTLCEVNTSNAITDSLVSPSTGGVQTGNLVIDYSSNISTAYTYDITNYCIAEIAASTDNSRGLALVVPRNTGLTNFGRVILGDRNSKYNKLEIKIYYLQYK
ncbi:protein of unknown function [Chitinophaga sp. CF118]|uniref:DUF4270 family protein n=1 Tax=Chitinophaga sp. CF118 TaxID=1884367 RepID=UPI0008E949C2|nr:DUF4270 family protein [Chitinophaga sp. CF118]SFE15469.1 protein of unknown function [Chitinophaga sp. CF118]